MEGSSDGEGRVQGRIQRRSRSPRLLDSQLWLCSHLPRGIEYHLSTTSPFQGCFCVSFGRQPYRKINQIPHFVRTHNPKVAGSNPAPATNPILLNRLHLS
jgi:hypothetical protein